MKEHIITFFSQFPQEVAVFVLAMIPVTELRASIPVAISWGMPPLEAFFWSVLGNITMGIIMLFVVRHVIHYVIDHIAFLRKIWERYIHRIETKNKEKFDRWGPVALILFVAIPLPMTGIVTGAIAASIFQVPFRKAALWLSCGSVIAGIIVTILSSIAFAAF